MGEFAAFMRSRLVELLLLTVSSAALFSTITYGFHVEDTLRQAYPAIVLIPLALTTYFTAISYSRRSVIRGSVGFVVLFAVFAAAVSTISGHAFFYDEYGNIGFYVLLGTVVTLLGYLLTRRKTLTLAYGVLGCAACAFMQFLYTRFLLAQLVIFALAAIALCAVCIGRMEARRIAGDEDIAPWQQLLTGAGMAAVSLGVAALVYFLVIAPLNPPAQEIKLVTEYYSLETVHVRGDQQVEHIENNEQISNNQEEGDKQTNNTNDEKDPTSGNQSSDNLTGKNGDGPFGAQGSNITGFGQETSAVDYFNDFSLKAIIALCVVIALVALVVLTKLGLRKHRYNNMMALPPNQRAIAFYHFFNKRFALLGIPRNDAATPMEHAAEIAGTVSPLEEGCEGATYQQLASEYCACVYGLAHPTEESLACCPKLYSAFFKNARKFIGTPKYLLRFFRL